MHKHVDIFYSLVVIKKSQGSLELVCDDSTDGKCQ